MMTNPTIQVPADKYHHAEVDLNRLQYKGLPLGICSSYYLDRTYIGDFDHRLLVQIWQLVRYLIKHIRKRRYLKNYHVSLIYFKTGRDRHYCAMEKAIRKGCTEPNKVLIIGPQGETDLSTGRVLYHVGLKESVEITYFLYRHRMAIRTILQSLQLSASQQRAYWWFLIRQLAKGLSLRWLLTQQEGLRLVGADYDRGNDSCTLFAAARSLQKPSFTLQHGVINPPVGFAPINADEIWVWGDMARLQLIASGVPDSCIHLTGTPIVETLTLTQEERFRIKQQLQLKSGKTIVLALSRPDKADDLKLVKLFHAIRQQYGKDEDNFVVKVHPTYPDTDYSWITNEFGLAVLPIRIPYPDFMNIVDVLLAHNSGIATEVLYYHKQVGILDVLDQSLGNGMELHKYLNVPLLKTADDFQQLVDAEMNRLPVETTQPHCSNASFINTHYIENQMNHSFSPFYLTGQASIDYIAQLLKHRLAGNGFNANGSRPLE
ncbi:MAG: hypothetical protein Q8914_06480 [Bacteroidota bacterium]|nr:hypothetical protein [Bacteroidota bacterium]